MKRGNPPFAALVVLFLLQGSALPLYGTVASSDAAMPTRLPAVAGSGDAGQRSETGLSQSAIQNPKSKIQNPQSVRDPAAPDYANGTFEFVTPYPTAEPLLDVAWSGKNALAVGAMGTLLLYNGSRGVFTTLPTRLEEWFVAVDVSPEGEFIAVGENGIVLTISTGAVIKSYPSPTRVILEDVAFHPSERKALIAGDGALLMWDGGGFDVISGGDPVLYRGISWHPDGKSALLAAGKVLIRYSADGLETLYTAAKNEYFTDVAWNPDGTLALITGGRSDGQGRLYSYDGSTLKSVAMTGTDILWGVSWHPSGTKATVVGESGAVITYAGGQVAPLFPSPTTADLYGVDWSGSAALIVGDGGTVVRLDTYNNALLLSRSDFARDTVIYSSDISPDGHSTLLVGAPGFIALLADGVLKETDVTNVDMFDVAWHPSGDYAVAVGDNGTYYTITIFPDTGGLSLARDQSGTLRALRSIAWHPEGNYALIAGDGGYLRRYEPDARKQFVPVSSGTQADLYSVAFSSNATFAYAAGWRNDARGQPTSTLLRCRNGSFTCQEIYSGSHKLSAVDFEPENGTAAGTGLATGTGYLVETDGVSARTKPLASPQQGPFYGAAAFPSGRSNGAFTLITGEGGQASLYDNWSRALSRLVTHDFAPLLSVAWEQSGRYALVAGSLGHVLRYTPNFPPAQPRVEPPATSDNSITLKWSWSAEPDFDRFEVHLSNISGFASGPATLAATVGDDSVREFTVSGLRSNTTYYIRVRAVDSGGLFGDSQEVQARTRSQPVPPAAVTLYTPSSVSSKSATLAWSVNQDPDFVSYEVHRYTASGTALTNATLAALITAKNDNSTTLSGLQNGTKYYFRVRVTDADGLFNDSGEVNATTLAEFVPPKAVRLLGAEALNDTAARLLWEQSDESDFLRYEVHVSKATGANGSAFTPSPATLSASIQDRNGTVFTVTGLANNTTYYFRIRVDDSEGLYNDSNMLSTLTLLPNPPPLPVLLHEPENITETAMDISWGTSGESDFRMYQLHRSETANFTPSNSSIVATLTDRNSTSQHISSLAYNTTYYFRVAVKDAANQTAVSNEVGGRTLANIPPPAVALDPPGNITNTSVTLAWTASGAGDFDRYEVHRSTDPNFTAGPGTLVAATLLRGETTTLLANLTESTTYYFLVRVIDAGGLFNDSNRVNATTPGPDIPPRAVVLNLPQNITRTTMRVEWSPATEADFARYELHMDTAPFSPSNATRAATQSNRSATSYSVQNLQPETGYYFIVRVFDSGGNYNDSNRVNDTTLPPNRPPEVSLSASPNPALTGDYISFTALANDTDGAISSTSWDFNGDGMVDWSGGADGNATWTYSSPGTYTAVFSVNDNEGATVEAQIVILVKQRPPPRRPPVVEAGPDMTVNAGDNVVFRDSAIQEAMGRLARVEWDFDGDGAADWTAENITADEFPILNWTYASPGFYTAALTAANDANLTGSDTLNITVVQPNRAPRAVITSPAPGAAFTTKDSLLLDGRKSTDDDGDALAYEWVSNIDKRLGVRASLAVQLSAGTHRITLTVSDGTLSGTATVNITVAPPPNVPPKVSVTYPPAGTTVKRKAIVFGTASDDVRVAYVEVRVDASGGFSRATGTREWSYDLDASGLEDGSHTLYIRAYDGTDYSGLVQVPFEVVKPKSAEVAKGLPGFDGFAALAAAALVAALISYGRRRRTWT